MKNDHLGFEILFLFQGVIHKYRPDFLVRLNNGRFLVLETKGQDSQQDRTKREFLDGWIRAVNSHKGFGHWGWAVSNNPADLRDILKNTQVDQLHRSDERSSRLDHHGK